MWITHTVMINVIDNLPTRKTTKITRERKRAVARANRPFAHIARVLVQSASKIYANAIRVKRFILGFYRILMYFIWAPAIIDKWCKYIVIYSKLCVLYKWMRLVRRRGYWCICVTAAHKVSTIWLKLMFFIWSIRCQRCTHGKNVHETKKKCEL